MKVINMSTALEKGTWAVVKMVPYFDNQCNAELEDYSPQWRS